MIVRINGTGTEKVKEILDLFSPEFEKQIIEIDTTTQVSIILSQDSNRFILPKDCTILFINVFREKEIFIKYKDIRSLIKLIYKNSSDYEKYEFVYL